MKSTPVFIKLATACRRAGCAWEQHPQGPLVPGKPRQPRICQLSWGKVSMSLTVLLRWTTAQWVISSRAWPHQVHGAALTNSTASFPRCCQCVPCSTSVSPTRRRRRACFQAVAWTTLIPPGRQCRPSRMCVSMSTCFRCQHFPTAHTHWVAHVCTREASQIAWYELVCL